MLMRDSIIRQVLKLLGEVSVYSDNRSEIYQYTSETLEEIIKSVAYRTDLKFNSTTVKLNSNGKNDLDENRFNLPIDFLNKIRFNVEARIEGEFIYSNSEEVYLQYCRNIDLSEYPEYLGTLITYLTALRLSESRNEYAKKINIFNTRVEEELKRIYNIEFTPKVRKVK